MPRAPRQPGAVRQTQSAAQQTQAVFLAPPSTTLIEPSRREVGDGWQDGVTRRAAGVERNFEERQ